MENQRFSVIHPEEVFTQTKEQPLETDILLPDYYPEISKILDCSVTLSVEAVTMTADKISISGEAAVSLMYMSAENELRIYETVTKYTKLIAGGSFEQDDICLVDQTVGALNYKAVSPRKMELRGAAAVKVSVFRKTETECLCDVSDKHLQVRNRSSETFQLHAFSVNKLEISDEITLPTAGNAINAVFNAHTIISLKETKTVSNKLMLNGAAEVRFLCISGDNTVTGKNTINLSFSKIIDVNGVQENDFCYISVRNVNTRIDFNNTTDSKASATIEADLVVISGCKVNAEYVDDIYAVHGEVKATRKNIPLYTDVEEKTVFPQFEGELQTYDMTAGDIVDTSVENITCGISYVGGQIDVSGSFRLKVLIKSDEKQYSCISSNCLFSRQFEQKECGWLCAASIVPETVSVEFCEESMLRYHGNLCLHMLQFAGMETEIVSDAVFEIDNTVEDREKIVLYYGMKGENLWTIAKENKTPVKAMCEMNTLETDVLPEDRLLVFRV